jgi:pSer/pThr/pTyr-binding forkhead associated (FHA) protein
MALTVVVRTSGTEGPSGSPLTISFDAPRIVIGRREGCEVRLPDPSVSHRHATIRQRGTEYIVVDEGSANGTFVGGVRLSPQAARVLRSGELIRVGRVWLEVRIQHVAPTENPHDVTKEIALGLVANALAAQGDRAALRVKVVAGPDAGRDFIMDEFERPFVIGRTAPADFQVTDPDASRRHVEVMRRGDQVEVRELGSKNGTQLSGRLLEPGKKMVWPRGESIQVGKNEMVYEDPVLEALGELERAADELMRDDESLNPPEVREPSGLPADRALGSSESVKRAPRQPKPPPVGAQTEPEGSRTAGQRWKGIDFLIALIALAVLCVSLIGIFWLFRFE